jgi:hypothetical protein
MRAVSVLLVIIVLVILALAAIYIYNPNLIYNFFGIPNEMFISGVSLEINNASPISCFGNVVQALPGFYTQKGSAFNYTLNVTNSCPSPHNVTSIESINNHFTVQVLEPKLQYEIFQNNRVPFKIRVTPPSNFNGGVLTLQVNVT